MSLPRASLLLLLVALASLGLSIGISTAEDSEEGPDVASVAWAERPTDVEGLDQAAAAVVEAEVTAVEGGPDLIGESSEENIPTQRISMSTTEILEGQAPPSFKLFKTGSEDLVLKNDPLYEIGESYVLFVAPRPEEPGTYIPAAPDGRLRLDAQDEAQVLIPGEIKEELQGLTPDEIDQELEG